MEATRSCQLTRWRMQRDNKATCTKHSPLKCGWHGLPDAPRTCTEPACTATYRNADFKGEDSRRTLLMNDLPVRTVYQKSVAKSVPNNQRLCGKGAGGHNVSIIGIQNRMLLQ